MGPCVRLLTKSSYGLISKANSWNCMVTMSDKAIKELTCLHENLSFLNGHPLRPSLSQSNIEVSVNASDLGFCVYEVSNEKTILKKEVFTKEDAIKSWTFLEQWKGFVSIRYSMYPSSDKSIGQHFSSSGHKIADLQIIPFEQIRSKNPWIRLSREKFYIRKLEPRLNRIV